jgi:hypothetical protein
MSKPSLVIVLAEDERHQRFVRRYLQKLDYPARTIRNEPLPAGKGSGEQWVRGRYEKAVQAYRDRAARAQTALVVIIDADAHDVNHRFQQLQTILDGERIVRLIPRRNIETWVLCLTGLAVNEETDYHHHPDIDERIKPAAEAFYDWSRPNAVAPGHSIPSLLAAIPEVRKLEH